MVAAYKAVMLTCQPFIVPKAARFTFSCNVDSKTVKFATYQEAWPSKGILCRAKHTEGTMLSGVEQNALSVSHYGAHELWSLYSACAEFNSSWVRVTKPTPEQTLTAQGLLALCPDHPQAALIQANINSASVEAAATAAQAAAAASRAQAVADHAQLVADGKFATSGKYLVGPDIQPGTWQSVGAKVEDCYWETSDASGNIIDNNFISIAPQFTITIPSDASGFTNSGCEFEWIGE